MPESSPELPDWERLLAAERHIQRLVPGAVLVGGTAAALHAGHRRSVDGDHVLDDLRGRFDEVLTSLEMAAGWRTDRIRRPVLILGQMEGVLTGIRQLRRTKPLETEQIDGLRVPTLAEMARMTARPQGSAAADLALLERSRALWNRNALDLSSDETLAQLLDRGEMRDWRALYRLAQGDQNLRRRLARVVATVPLPLPRFWLAALASLGEPVDLGMDLPPYGDSPI